MKHTIAGFSQKYALTLKKKIYVIKNGKEIQKEIKIDCTDLVLLRWLIFTYGVGNPIKINFELLINELPILDISKQACKDRIKKMCEFNLIEPTLTPETLDDEDVIDLLINKNLKGFGLGNFSCKWCGIKTLTLHAHHYPIPKSKGGTETVLICPNCHYEFHSMLESPKFKINKDILNNFDESER